MTKNREHLFKKGVSGNPAGRKPGSRNNLSKAREEILEKSDLELQRKFLRAVLTGDMDVLAKYGVKSEPSASAKISASKELVKVNSMLAERGRADKDALKEINTPATAQNTNSASFSPVATFKTGSK